MPNIDPTFNDITPAQISTPQTPDWYTVDVAAGVPDSIAPYLVAQGWEINSVSPFYIESEFSGWRLSLTRKNKNEDEVANSLLSDLTEAYNEGRAANDTRYEDLIRNLQDLLSKAQTHMDSAKTILDDKIDVHLTTLSSLEDEYDTFFTEVKTDLDGLTITLEADRTRVNNQFDAQLAESDQQLVNRGFYSSAMVSNIDAGIEERRALALTEITEREQRLLADVVLRKNQIYVEILRMRAGLVDSQMALTNRQQQFLEYQLDTRNNLALAMFGFVERREDTYPSRTEIATVAAELGATE